MFNSHVRCYVTQWLVISLMAWVSAATPSPRNIGSPVKIAFWRFLFAKLQFIWIVAKVSQRKVHNIFGLITKLLKEKWTIIFWNLSGHKVVKFIFGYHTTVQIYFAKNVGESLAFLWKNWWKKWQLLSSIFTVVFISFRILYLSDLFCFLSILLYSD